MQIIQKILQQQIGEHIPCGHSVSTIWAFDHIENKHTLHSGKDSMKQLCTSLREHAENITDFEKKKMSLLTKEELKSYQDTKDVIFVEKNLKKVKY